MKSVESIILDIQENYGVTAPNTKNGVCDLCGYDTSKVNNCTLNTLPYKDMVLTICTRCKTQAEKQWIGKEMSYGTVAGRLHGMMMPIDYLLNGLNDFDVAQLLTLRLQKRLSGYQSQKQMVPQ